MDLIPFDREEGFAVSVDWELSKDKWIVTYHVLRQPSADPIVWPAATTETPERRDGLYRSTCFEWFVSDGEAYLEWNIIPDGSWAIYGFSSYRQPLQETVSLPQPAVTATKEGEEFTVGMEIQVDRSAWPLDRESVWGGQPAVILDHEGRLSYWAPFHAGSKPDFHRLDEVPLVAIDTIQD